ncbi:MAG: hypothetical protein Q8K37_01915 [Alphaproteobacteria bacterium]|nr:hypothetical protein [Alphaproteobacteria bacterium]
MHYEFLKTIMSKQSADSLRFQKDLSSGIPLVSRCGQLFSWNSFSNIGGNNNVCVVGDPENGKSVFIKELMASTLEIGGRVFVFDVGRKFEKSCRLLDGQFIDFTAQTNLLLNPFSKLSDGRKDGPLDPYGMISPVLAMMTGHNLEVGTYDYKNLEKAIFKVWITKGRKATITDLAEHLKHKSDTSKAKELGIALFPYTKEGAYGHFFEGSCNLNFDNPLVVIELGGLKGDKHLQTVVMSMIIFQIMNQMFLEGIKTPFNIVIDELGDMFGHQSSDFIKFLSTRMYQYYGSLIIGTQSVNDFYASSSALAAFENSDWMCLLSQKKESIDQLKNNERISLDPHMEAVLKSVHTKHGEYAEIMIIGPTKYSVGCFSLDLFSQTIYSSKRREELRKNCVHGLLSSIRNRVESSIKNKTIKKKDQFDASSPFQNNYE